MIYDYSPTYTPRGHKKGFEKDIEYFVAYIDTDGDIKTTKVKIEQLYSESSPVPDRTPRWYIKLFIPQPYHKSFIHRWFDKVDYKYEFDDELINFEYIAPTEQEAIINYFNIMSNRHQIFADTYQKNLDTFADEYPEIYLNKIQNYKGLRCSHPPHYEAFMNKMEKYSIQSYSY